MHRLLLLLALAFALPASAQVTVQEWFRPQVAFTWPQPFSHVPQRFEAQAVRFTGPGGPLAYTEVFAHSSTASPDGFNDTLVVSVHAPDADGRPGTVTAERRFEFAEVEPNKFTRLPLAVPADQVAGDFWLSFELRVAGQPDQLVLVSGGADEPPLDRSAARITGEGWKLMRETQFGKEYNFHVRAGFGARALAIGDQTDTPGFRITSASPQPASDFVRVRVEGVAQAGTLELFDLLGRRVIAQPLTADATFDTSGLPSGLYVLRAASQSSIATRTLVVR